MDTAGFPGQLESQILARGILAEIRSVTSGPQEFVHLYRYHTLTRRLTSRPSFSVGRFDDRLEQVRPLSDLGDVVFHPATLPLHTRHRSEWSTRAVTIHVLPETLDGILNREASLCTPESLASLDIRDLCVRRALRDIADELMSPGFASAYLIESLAMGAIVHLGRHSVHKPNLSEVVRGGLAAWQLRMIKDRLQASAEGALPNVSELAALINVSSRHLRSAFQESTGQKISQYVHMIRLERAQSLLSETDFPLKDIAARLGFSAAYSFTVAFQRETGQTPSAYRRQHAKLTR